MTYQELLSKLHYELMAVALDGRFAPTKNSAEMLLMKAYRLGYSEAYQEGYTDGFAGGYAQGFGR
jgi:flagellar biosynthesis/type III secretory pathway protein FliH